jgi:hypothetical protein
MWHVPTLLAGLSSIDCAKPRLCAIVSITARLCARRDARTTYHYIGYDVFNVLQYRWTVNNWSKPCPMPAPSPTPSKTSCPELATKPTVCECPLVNCLANSETCNCINTAAQNCYDKCGGKPPTFQSCEAVDPDTVDSGLSIETVCECDDIMCIQSWPESCLCENAAAQACHQKCGGTQPSLKV